MRQQRYLTTAVLIAVKGRKNRIATIPVFKPVPVKKQLMSKHRVTEDGSIITNGQKVLTVIG